MWRSTGKTAANSRPPSFAPREGLRLHGSWAVDHRFVLRHAANAGIPKPTATHCQGSLAVVNAPFGKRAGSRRGKEGSHERGSVRFTAWEGPPQKD